MKEKRKKSSSDVARMKIRISGNVDHLTAIQASSDPDYSKPVKEAVKKP